MTRFEIIQGVVKDFKIVKGAEDFVFPDRCRFSDGLAVVGESLAEHSVHSRLFDELRQSVDIDMQVFTCRVDGRLIIGHFHDIGFKEDEVVEFVVKKHEAFFLCQAARSESQRIMWMPPYQTRGHVAHRRSDVKWTLILSLGAAIAVELSEILIFQRHVESSLLEQACVMLGIFLSVLIVNVFARYHLADFSKDATDVFRSLGFPKPSEVDLHKIHRRAQEKIYVETKRAAPVMSPWSFFY
jgi:hypothetical protein